MLEADCCGMRVRLSRLSYVSKTGLGARFNCRHFDVASIKPGSHNKYYATNQRYFIELRFREKSITCLPGNKYEFCEVRPLYGRSVCQIGGRCLRPYVEFRLPTVRMKIVRCMNIHAAAILLLSTDEVSGIDWWTYRLIDGWKDGWVDGWMGGWMDGMTDGWGFSFIPVSAYLTWSCGRIISSHVIRGRTKRSEWRLEI